MADTVQPRDAKDVEAAVQWALAESKTVEIVGHGSKRAIGRAGLKATSSPTFGTLAVRSGPG